MKTRAIWVSILLLGFLPGYSQYLTNPSFEGTLLMIGPPPYWEICDYLSTPNVQPGKYGVYLPPSDGMTYIGLLTRDNYTWEDMQATFDTPLSKDSCYVFKIDLAFQEYLTWSVVQPIILKIYGSNGSCEKENVLWQSPAIANEDWDTFEFIIHNDEFDITHLVLETYYVGSTPYWGYMLLDNIRISPTPFAELGNDTTLTLCENDSLVLDPGSGYYGYLWQDGSTASTYTVDTTGLYWVSVFNAQGCSWTDSIFVTVEEYLPLTSAMIDSTLICKGQELTLTATFENGAVPYSYEWLNLPDTTQSITITADSSMYFYVEVTDECGFTLMDSIKVVIADDPEIDLGNDTLICPDGNFNLHAGQGFIQYLWQDGSTDSTFNVTEPGTFWVQVTSIFGCSATDSIIVDLFPPIPLDLGNDTTLCIGDSVIFNAGGGYPEYLWQNNSSDSSCIAYNSGVYWVMVTDVHGCHTTDSAMATFLSLPEIDLGSDFSLCDGEQHILNAGSGYLSYLWQDNDTSQFYLVTGEGWYWVKVDNGCGEATDSVYVEVYPSPEPSLGPDTTLCSGESIQLDFGTQYVSYLWQDNSTLPFYTVNSPGVYSVMVENTFGCFGEDEVLIDYSTSQLNLGGDKQVCEGEAVILEAGDGFISYLWQDNSSAQTYTVSSEGTYSVVAEDEFGCELSDEVQCSYFPHPAPDLGPDMKLCEGETALLLAPEGDFVYYWNGIQGGQSLEVSSPGQYILSVANPCDSVNDAITVEVLPLPDINLGEDDVLFPGNTIELDAGSGYDNYLWQDGSGNQYFVVTENNIDPSNPYYYVEVTKGICKNSDTLLIELYQIWVPNVITPNGDNRNDIFKANPEKWSGVSKHLMRVFNRWGEKVWESNDFESGWDGKRNGSYVADGTYYWVLDVYAGPENLKQTLKGTLSVLDAD